MQPMSGTFWGPPPLPELLTGQLRESGFEPTDAASCASEIRDCASPGEAAPFFVALGSCKFLTGDIDGAVASWRHAIGSGNDTAASHALLNLGLLYEHLHLDGQASAVLDAAAERGVVPYTTAAVMASARVSRRVGDIDRAMHTMAQLTDSMTELGMHGDLAEVLFGLGDLAAEVGHVDRAERAWRAVLTQDPSPVRQQARSRLVDLLIATGRAEEADDLFDESDDGYFVDMAVTLDRAEALLRSGDERSAAELVREVEGSAASDVDRFRLAEVRRDVGLINEAIDELELLLAHAEVDVRQRAAFVLGEIYREHDVVDAAIAMFERVVDQPDAFWSRKAAISLGDMYFAADESEKAVELWDFAALSTVGTVRTTADERLELAFAGPAEPVQMDLAEARTTNPLDQVDPSMDLAEAQTTDPLDQVDPSMDLAEAKTPDSFGRVEPTVILLDPQEPVVIEPDLAPVVGDLQATAVDGSGQSAHDHESKPGEEVAQPSQIINLDELESQEVALISDPAQVARVAATQHPLAEPLDATVDEPERPVDVPSVVASPFSSLSDPNPYAALAPHSDVGDPTPSSRNPYAELAPNYDDIELPPGVKAGDWESLIESKPADSDAQDLADEPGRSSPFSRYT